MTSAAAFRDLLACSASADEPEPGLCSTSGRIREHQPGHPAVRLRVRLQGRADQGVHDPLEVRAFVVSNGTDAAAFVVADLTGWFAPPGQPRATASPTCVTKPPRSRGRRPDRRPGS